MVRFNRITQERIWYRGPVPFVHSLCTTRTRPMYEWYMALVLNANHFYLVVTKYCFY